MKSMQVNFYRYWWEFVMVGIFLLAGCTQAPADNLSLPETPTREGTIFTPTIHLQPPTNLPTENPRRETVVEPEIASTLLVPYDFSVTALSNVFGQCQNTFEEQRLSPQKDWYLCERGDAQGADLLLINADGRTWRFSYADTFGIEYEGDIRYFKWTPDEAFLYFGVMNPIDGPDPLTANAEALFRMNMSDGSVVKVLGTVDYNDPSRDLYVLSLSPTGRRLVYSGGFHWRGDKPRTQLHVVDLQSGREAVISMDEKYEQMGDFTWSEDGLYLAYKLYTGSADFCKYTYSVALLDLRNFTATTFLPDAQADGCSNAPIYEILSVSNEAVYLEYQGKQWIYDIDARKLEPQD